MSKHTPGPWRVFICDDGGQWSGWPLSINAVDDEDKSIVRPGGQYPYEWDATMSQHEAIANARLIAAAPELLEACKSALGAFERNDAIDWDDLAAAIAKATGAA